MKKNFCLNIFVIFAVSMLFASCAKDEVDLTGEIYGKVTDALTGEPVDGVNITITPGGRSTVAGSDGSFSFVECQPGQYSLQAQKSGYKTNYKQISVLAGETAVGDIILEPIAAEANLVVSPSELVFGSSLDVLTFNIENQGNAGDAAWNISGITADWLTVSPVSGVTGQGKTSVVSVTVDRTGLTESQSTIITVNVPGGSQAVRVTVNP